MTAWLLRWIPRPSRDAIDRADATSDRLDQVVARRQQEARATVSRESERRRRIGMTGAFIFDGLNTGEIEPERDAR